MNFTLCLIITITMLSKILGAFNAAFSYTGISLRSLVKKVGIIYHHLAYSMRKPPLLMSEYACLRVQYVNPCVEWSRGGSTLSLALWVFEHVCHKSLWKRQHCLNHCIFWFILKSVNAFLAIRTFFFLLFCLLKMSPRFVFWFIWTNCYSSCLEGRGTIRYNAPPLAHVWSVCFKHRRDLLWEVGGLKIM